MKWFWPAVAAGLAANGVNLRRRVEALPTLDPTDEPPAPGYVVATAAGVELDEATLRAATHHARARGLDGLDLVPGDLPGERLLDLVRWVDPRTYVGKPMALGRTAAQAVVISDDVVARAGITRTTGLGLVEMDELVATVKRYAPWSTGLVLVPWLRSSAGVSGERWARQQAAYRGATSLAVLGRAVSLAALLRAAGTRRVGPLAALAAFHAVPALATAGTAATPRDARSLAALRSARSAIDIVASMGSGLPVVSRPDPEVAAQRRSYLPDLAKARSGAYVEDRRDDCPICGSTDLELALEVDDVLQRKPGRFRMDRCGGCGTVFQNPRLTIEGLGFYYRDFYDGVSAEYFEMVFTAEAPSYVGRVDMVARITEPRRWLDVGTGHGHFCLVARDRWPKAEIDGLDMTDAIAEAERRGWVGTGHRGMLPDLAPSLAGRYDVVSMHHYLEHTRDPGGDLDAAATVLEPGGYLEIEVPHPGSPAGRLLKGAWVPFFQPQHQHMIPPDTLGRMLAERGFTTVAVETAEAHQPYDLMFASLLTLNRWMPPQDVPWAPEPPTVAQRVTRNAMIVASLPVILAAVAADVAVAPVVKRRWPNTYRIVARYDGPPAG